MAGARKAIPRDMNDSHSRRRNPWIGAAGLALLGATSCVEPRERIVEREERPGRRERETVIVHDAPVVEERVVYVQEPPPPPRREVIVERERPSPEHIWVEGHWRWAGHGYDWVGGHWDHFPGGGRREWVGGHWQNRPGQGWDWVEGHWR